MFIREGQSKYLIISLIIGITIISTAYLVGLFFVSSLLIYGLFFGDKKVCRYKIINEFTVPFALFAFFWGIAIFGGSPIYADLTGIFGVNKFILFLFPLFFVVLIKKLVPIGINKFKGVLPRSRFKNLLERYQIVLVLSLFVVLFVGLKMISTTSDFKIFFANNIYWIVFIPLSFLHMLNHFVNGNKDRSISFLSCFLIFSYFFTFVFLLGIYSGIAGFYSTDWIIRFIGYAFFEMIVFGMFFVRDVFGQSRLKNLKTYSKVALLLLLLISNIFVTAYYVDKPGDAYPLMVASDPMLSAEKYVIEGVQPEYIAGFPAFPAFIYENFDFKLEMSYHPKSLSYIINNLAENKKPDQDAILFLNIDQIKKYGRTDHDPGFIKESKLSKIEQKTSLNKIYSNDEIFIYR